MPKFWSENDFEIYLVKCPEGHDEVEIQKREIVPDSNNIRAYFRCKICYTKFIEQGIFIFNEESIEYKPPGVVSGKK